MICPTLYFFSISFHGSGINSFKEREIFELSREIIFAFLVSPIFTISPMFSTFCQESSEM